MHDARMFCDIPVGQMYIGEECFELLIDPPPDDAHLRSISKTLALARNLMLLVCLVDEIMARFTQRNQVIGAISSCLA